MRRRLDAELVRRGLATSRTAARELVLSGRVLVGGAPADKPARLVDAGDAVVVQGDPPRFVGRGGEKLDAALDRFGIGVAGADVLDAGASTGGFTDCLLQRGAASVVALDVGHGQLHERLRGHDAVVVLERTNVRHADLAAWAPFAGVVADLSFISLTAVVAALVGWCAPGGWLVLLVKPQFEVGRVEASRGRGVVTDPELWRTALAGVLDAAGDAGASIMGLMPSPLRGADGNVEFLVHLVRPPAPGAAVPDGTPAAGDVRKLIDAAVGEAAAPAGDP